MECPVILATKLRHLAAELEAEEVLGKVDWSKIMQILMQILPLIVALFEKEPETK